MSISLKKAPATPVIDTEIYDAFKSELYKSVNNIITDFKLNNASLTYDEMKEMLMKAIREYDMTQLSVF